jgi:hypothetical protein
MSLSLNQIESTARKAVRGAGLYWGLAEDAGRAVSRLEMAGLPGMRWLVELLDKVDHQNPEVCRLECRNNTWHAANGLLSPLVAGPNLADWIYSPVRIPGDAHWRLLGVVCPKLLIGYTSIAVLLSANPFRLGWGQTRVAVAPDHLQISGPLDHSGPADVIVAAKQDTDISDQGAIRYSFKVAACEVDRCTLDVLESLAYRTYVEATESSRLSGAGAGLSDND